MNNVRYLFALFLVFFSVQNSWSIERDYEIDSSEDSSIDFLKMEAVMSARIIHFRWDVASESNGDHFMIEKSIDNGETWSKVSRVTSVSNHKERHTYEISSINMAEGIREIFRISRVDIYGSKEVLDAVDFTYPVLSNMKLIPDPKKVQRSVTVSCESLIESIGSVYIYDMENDLILVEHMDLGEGYNRLEVGIKNFRPGEYRVVIRNEFTDAVSRKLVVY